MKTNIILVTLIFNLSIFSVSAQNKYPGNDIIGRGYDIFDEYANNKSVSNYTIFDLDKMESKTNSLNQTLPEFINIKNISNHLIKTVEGSSKNQYTTNLSQEMGLSGNAFFFQGSINNQFNETTSQTTDYLYYTHMDINTKWEISLDTRNIDTLINYLDTQFKSDLTNLSPEELFELYGTHFISSAYLGGRIDYSTSTEMTNSVNKNEIKLAIDAKYKTIKGNFELDDKSKNTFNKINTSTKLNIVGGNSEYTNNINNYEQYMKWADGIKISPVLSGFNKRSLKPIWILTKNERRKTELENYFNTVILPKHPLPSIFKKDSILDNENLEKEFDIHIVSFFIKKDCDTGTMLSGDENGEFKYRVRISSDDKIINSLQTGEGRIVKVWSGYPITINKKLRIKIPFTINSSIKIDWKLTEIDNYTDNDRVGEGFNIHQYPFSSNNLYNRKDKEALFWEEKLWNSNECNASLIYQIKPAQNKSAYDYGNKGWEEFKKKNFKKSQFYNREALKIDNSLLYIHYNIALIYLIENNPRTFEKYKFITNLCMDKELVSAALKDIMDYEAKNGTLENSENVKFLLKTRL